MQYILNGAPGVCAENDLASLTSSQQMSSGGPIPESGFGDGFTLNSYFPSSPGDEASEYVQDRTTACRRETITLESGAITRILTAEATDAFDIARMPVPSFAICYVISGEMTITQDDRADIVRQGDFVVIDGASPPPAVTTAGVLQDFIVLTIPKEHYAFIHGIEDDLTNFVLCRRNATAPIFSCLALIADEMHVFSRDKLGALYNACIALLPVAAGCYDRNDETTTEPDDAHYLLSQILHYLNRNLADASLAPSGIAKRFGISVRYLHRLFEATGTTFLRYVIARRLDRIREELVASPTCSRSIAELAQKWGFAKVTSFNRTFRKHFGTSPSEYRGEVVRLQRRRRTQSQK